VIRVAFTERNKGDVAPVAKPQRGSTFKQDFFHGAFLTEHVKDYQIFVEPV
jgi:hypothetical protein